MGVRVNRVCDNRLSETPGVSFIEPWRIEIQSSAEVGSTRHATIHNTVNECVVRIQLNGLTFEMFILSSTVLSCQVFEGFGVFD